MSDLADRLTDKLQNNSIENSQKATSPAKNEMSGSTDQLDGLAKNAYERRIQRVEDEKKELVRKLENSTRALQKFAHGAPPIVDNDVAAANESNANEIRRLQDELNTLTKRNQGKIQHNIGRIRIFCTYPGAPVDMWTWGHVHTKFWQPP